MKTSVKVVLTSLALGISASALAAPNGWDQPRRDNPHVQMQHHAPSSRHQAPPPRHHVRHDRRADFRAGDRLPSQFRGNRYQVNNWRHHRLSAPPRGYHWVKVRDRFVLVSNNNYRVHHIR